MMSNAVSAQPSGNPTTLSDISHKALMDEHAALTTLLAAVEPLASLEPEIMRNGKTYANAMRAAGAGHGMEAFLHTYGLDTREGVALMCLAEALLRIPDSETANQLIADTFEDKNWRAPIEGDESWLISASSWGLFFTGKVVDFGNNPVKGITSTLRSLVDKAGDPVIRQALRQAMRVIGAQFVLGETIEAGIKNSKSWAKKGFRFSYDILGEGARSDEQAQAYIAAYRHAIAQVGKGAKDLPLFAAPSISVKLSALHARYQLNQKERVLSELAPRLKEILLLAKEHNITVSIDAEEANRLDIELILFEQIFADADFKNWNGIGFVLQGYQKRAYYVIDFLRELAHKHGRIIPIRLVKGAYWDSEIKYAQVMGLEGYPVFTRKEHTDVSYLACANKILQNADCFYPQFATHNARTIASIQALAGKYRVAKDAFEFQRLHGMGENLHDMIIKDYPSRIYAPIGEHQDLLAYLIRRLLENGANTSFVNLLMDDDTSIDELLEDPVAKTKQHQASMNPAIPLPCDIYGDRKNSLGYETGYLKSRDELQSKLSKHGDIMTRMGHITPVDKDTLTNVITTAHAAFPAWSTRTVEERCAIVESIADKFREHEDELLSLLIFEAGKTYADAISEVREAADFCRYYALQARKLMGTQTALTSPTGESNKLGLYPRGVFGCISPWNFPLAIFTGQVIAALVTGNCVIAKPAEQTPRIAMFAVKLMHEAGIPKEVLNLAIGKGSVIGGTLTSDMRIGGIVFTGSVEVAHIINRTLAARDGAIVPFIAETGGMNCMILDSSALLEQAVDDILLSAFGSAGQRCSGLRILYVQDDIADKLIALLKGAIQELHVGTSSKFMTDVGPVIDTGAQKELLAHIEHMKQTATFITAAREPDDVGSFVPPHAFEIKHISELEKEVFGPVLHIIRYKATELEKVADEINSAGYGLTFGIHSRVQENIDFFTQHIHTGNMYVNRSMIGAVVGVQPFGGEGLSGTGPKAGGPYYLLKFLHERTLTVNTAAIGGNLDLLTQET